MTEDKIYDKEAEIQGEQEVKTGELSNNNSMEKSALSLVGEKEILEEDSCEAAKDIQIVDGEKSPIKIQEGKSDEEAKVSETDRKDSAKQEEGE